MDRRAEKHHNRYHRYGDYSYCQLMTTLNPFVGVVLNHTAIIHYWLCSVVAGALINNMGVLMRRYYLGNAFPDIYLSSREAQCMAYLIKDYTYKRVGDALRISPRTAEIYAASIKRKTGCSSKKALIAFIKQTFFINYVDTLTQSILFSDD